jgi:ATP-dependent 26S proteasome regulatory subunit
VARNLQNLPGPLFLALDGAPGTGKTFAVRVVLDRAKVRRVTLSGADLESNEAGRPAALIRRAYLTAATAVATGRPAAVVLDDLDAALGRWDDATTYTVNNQLTCAELMHLADSPTLVDNRTVRRVPIILTCNNLLRLYAPLRRPGRMQVHPWALTPGERLEVIQAIFDGFDPDAVVDLLTEHPRRPVAFFADLRRRVEESGVRAAVRRLDPAEAVRRALAGQLAPAPRSPVTSTQLLALARRLAAEQTTRNHLEGS